MTENTQSMIDEMTASLVENIRYRQEQQRKGYGAEAMSAASEIATLAVAAAINDLDLSVRRVVGELNAIRQILDER